MEWGGGRAEDLREQGEERGDTLHDCTFLEHTGHAHTHTLTCVVAVLLAKVSDFTAYWVVPFSSPQAPLFQRFTHTLSPTLSSRFHAFFQHIHYNSVITIERCVLFYQ